LDRLLGGDDFVFPPSLVDIHKKITAVVDAAAAAAKTSVDDGDDIQRPAMVVSNLAIKISAYSE